MCTHTCWLSQEGRGAFLESSVPGCALQMECMGQDSQCYFAITNKPRVQCFKWQRSASRLYPMYMYKYHGYHICHEFSQKVEADAPTIWKGGRGKKKKRALEDLKTAIKSLTLNWSHGPNQPQGVGGSQEVQSCYVPKKQKPYIWWSALTSTHERSK